MPLRQITYASGDLSACDSGHAQSRHALPAKPSRRMPYGGSCLGRTSKARHGHLWLPSRMTRHLTSPAMHRALDHGVVPRRRVTLNVSVDPDASHVA